MNPDLKLNGLAETWIVQSGSELVGLVAADKLAREQFVAELQIHLRENYGDKTFSILEALEVINHFALKRRIHTHLPAWKNPLLV